MAIASEYTPYSPQIFLFPLVVNISFKIIITTIIVIHKRKLVKAKYNIEILRGIHYINPGYEVITANLIQTGDFIRIQRNQPVPCDILVLDTDEKHLSNYIATVETSSVNGSSELSIKKALNCTKVNERTIDIAKGNFIEYRKKLSGLISYTKPDVSYDNFEALVQLRNDPKIEKASLENLIVKGSVLKTGWVLGLVLYVGNDCKGYSYGTQIINTNRRSYAEKMMQACTFALVVNYLFYAIISQIANSLYITHESIYHLIDHELLSGMNIIIFMILYMPIIPVFLSGLHD